MAKLNYFNYCAAAIFIMIFVSITVRRIVKGKINRYFLWIVIVGLVSVAFDIASVTLDNIGPGNVALKYIMHTGYLFVHNLSTPTYLLYLLALGNLWHRMRKHPLFFELLASPIVIVGVALVINFFAPIVFYLDENDAYTRGDAFWMLYASAVIYVLYTLYFLIRNHVVYRKKMLALVFLFPLQIAAVVVQMVRPNMPIEMFAQSLGMFLIFSLIQRPEERVDTVTGLGKYDACVENIKTGFFSNREIALLLVSVVNYHALYEILGYDGVSRMLRIIADKLEELNKKTGLHADVYHLDEGRFCLVTDQRYAQRVEEAACQINETLKKGMRVNEMDINTTAHACVIYCPQDVDDFETLSSFSHDFSAGRYTGEVLHAHDILQKDRYNLVRHMDAIIERAFANNSFSVYYQPIYSVKEKRFNSAEALLRLKDEEHGFISPDIFIPAAEKSGAIHKIGEFVMEEVCRFVAGEEFKELGLDYIEVNLSVAQCMQRELAESIMETLDKYHVTPDKINLEITETAASNSQKIMEENIDKLTNAGLKFSLDDFGTGYSNMRRVASLPLTLVKLDKTFTGTEGNANMEIVLQNTIHMLKDMHMKIVVEGVETKNMVDQFSELECEYIQGFYYSKPIPREDFVAFIRKNNKGMPEVEAGI